MCSDTIYNNLEKKIISYSDSRCKEILKNRIEANRYGKAFGRCVYWKYWGDLQIMFNTFFREKRRSREVNELFKVLSRNLDLGYKIDSIIRMIFHYVMLFLQCQENN